MTFTAFGAGAAFFAAFLRAGAFFVAFFAALRAILHSPLQRLSCVKLNEIAFNSGLFAARLAGDVLSDATHFLMERDHASPEKRRKPAKNADFGAIAANPWQIAPRVATQKS
ncbi:MAG: hypothetical protein AB7Q23_13780 [Hyphomonadaceae bacterium]